MGDSEDCASEGSDGEFLPGATDLPPAVRRRVNALKQIQLATFRQEVEYYREIHQLDLKYQKTWNENNEQRRKILVGEYEPTDKECEWKEDEDETITKLESLKIDEKTEFGNQKGIPDFWLTVLKNANDTILHGLVEPIDMPILKSLEDITVSLPDTNSGFTLKFYFADNDYFTNKVLTKEYELKNEIDPDEPLEFDGPEMSKAKGCKIDWKPGKNPGTKVVKQKVKQKGKGKGGQKFVTKEEKRDTFFNFFKPPKVPDNLQEQEEVDDVTQALVAEDFDVGINLKEKIIPKAVLYFTGDALSDDEFDDFDSDDDLEED